MNTPIYLDYASTTPLDPEVLKAMLPYMSEIFGNPGSLHSYGQKASAAVFEARQAIAKALGCHYSEIIFTGSATEANGLALRGALANWRSMNYEVRSKEDKNQKTILHNSNFILQPRIVVSSIEHESILETAKDLEKDGVEVIYLPVSKEGIVNLKKLKEALNERTVLVSVMYGNNEVGTIQPIAEISKIIRNFRLSLPTNQLTNQPINHFPLLHSDAVQAFQYLNCNVDELGVDLMTLSAHKIYGPKGIGALYCRKHEVRSMKYGATGTQTLIHNSNFLLHPQITGGGQEFGLRSGTENVSAIVGFAKAVSLATSIKEKEKQRVGLLREELWNGIKKISENAVRYGREENSLPNILNFSIPKISGEQLVVSLDLLGIAVSSGSACSARSTNPSKVLLAMGFDSTRAKNNIRISLGRMTKRADVASFLKALRTVKERLD